MNLNQERREKKARNKEFTLNLLRKMGYDFVMHPGGSAQFKHGKRSVFIAPTTGAWSVQGSGPTEYGRGVQHLINYLATGVNNTYER